MISVNNNPIHRKRNKTLGVPELIAIALGGMVGGGIFTILGISVSMIGAYTPIAIIIGGMIASLAAYSYIKLGIYYKDEGATYSFYKKTFPNSPFAASLIGWWVVFGYISKLIQRKKRGRDDSHPGPICDIVSARFSLTLMAVLLY